MTTACTDSSLTSEAISTTGHANILPGRLRPRKPDRPPRPVIPALTGNGFFSPVPANSPDREILPPEHAVPVAVPPFTSDTKTSAVRFAPYFYRYRELQGRISQNKGKNIQNSDKEENYLLSQNIRHLGKDLQITLSLTLPPETNNGKSAVIFSQKIPDGWQFVRNQGCSGWHTEQHQTLKFLAAPDRPETPLQISLFFTSRNTGGEQPTIEKATCAIQDGSGLRKLCHAR